MAAVARWYNRATLYALNGTYCSSGAIGSASVSIVSQPIQVALLTSTYTFAATHNVYGDLTNELTTTGGYTAGGKALTTIAFNQATAVSNLTADNVVWTASGGGIAAWRYAALYINATVGGIVKPLIVVNDNNGVDVPATAAPNTLTITWNATGVMQVTHS